MNNLEEMKNILETYNLPRLNQKEIRNINRLITKNETESIIFKIPNRSQEPDGFTDESFQTSRGLIIFF